MAASRLARKEAGPRHNPRMPCTYYECITLFTAHLPWLQGEELAWVMGRGVCEWLGWPLGHLGFPLAYAPASTRGGRRWRLGATASYP